MTDVLNHRDCDCGGGGTVERHHLLATLHAEARACRRCVAAGYIEPTPPVFDGRLEDRVMVIGQAPGAASASAARPFAGPAGDLLAAWLEEAGFPGGYFREHTYLTSLTRCFPGKSRHGGGDRPPSKQEVALCRPYLERELEIVRPSVVFLVGRMAIEALLPDVTRPVRLDDTIGASMTRAGRLYLPLPHPSGVSRWLNDPSHRMLVRQALALLSEFREANNL